MHEAGADERSGVLGALRATAARWTVVGEAAGEERGADLVRIFCPAPRCGRIVAWVRSTSKGPLFESLIYPRPADAGEVLWEHEARRLALSSGLADRSPTELELIVEWLTGGAPGAYESTETTLIVDLVSLPAAPGGDLPGLWARCRHHGEGSTMDRRALERAVSEAKAARKPVRVPVVDRGPSSP